MFRGFFSTWAGLIINAVVLLLLTPVLVHGLGAFYYGMWILVSSVTDNYGLLDIGMTYSMQRFVARYRGANDRQAMNETFMTGLSVAACISLAVFVVTAILIGLLPGFFHLSGEARSLFRVLLIIQSGTIAFSMPQRIMGAYMNGLHRFDLYNGCGALQGILKGLVFWAVIHVGGRVLAVSVAQLLIVAFMLLVTGFATRVADPQLRMQSQNLNWARTREMGEFSVFVFVTNISTRLKFFTDSIVIAHVLTVALTTPFNVVGRLMEMFRLAFYPITGPLATAMNKLEGEQRRPEMNVLLLRSTRICTLLAFLGGEMLLLHGRDILRIWMGAPYAAYYNLIVILTVGYIVMQVQQGSNAYLYARGGHKVMAFLALVDGVANLALSVYWAKSRGLAGVALGTTVPMLIVFVFVQPWYTLRVAKILWRDYFRQAFLRPLIVASLTVPSGLLIRWQMPPTNLVKLGLVGSAEGVLFIALAYRISLDDYERDRTRQYITSLLHRLRLLKSREYEIARTGH